MHFSIDNFSFRKFSMNFCACEVIFVKLKYKLQQTVVESITILYMVAMIFADLVAN